MNETNKFYDEHGDYIQAKEYDGGRVEFDTFGGVWLNPDDAIKFAEQIIELAKEVKSKND